MPQPTTSPILVGCMPHIIARNEASEESAKSGAYLDIYVCDGRCWNSAHIVLPADAINPEGGAEHPR